MTCLCLLELEKLYTEEAANKLRDYFQFNIPERWSIAHLYQAILNETTRQRHSIYNNFSWIHSLVFNRTEIGVGDASGMFPLIKILKNMTKKN